MLETPSTPLWLELIKAFGGPVIAAIFVIVGLMWKDRIERKNSAQSWFEQTYIKDGLDMLMCHLSALKDCTFETKRIVFYRNTLPALPIEVQWRVSTLLPTGFFMTLRSIVEAVVLSTIKEVHPLVLTEDENSALARCCAELVDYTQKVRPVLLGVRIRHKRQVYKVCQNRTLKKVVNAKDEEFLGDESLDKVTFRIMEMFRDRLFESAQLSKKAGVKVEPVAPLAHA
jgi:hypothetical protein